MHMASFAAPGANAVCPLCLQGILQFTTGTPAAAALPGGGIGYVRAATCPRCQAGIDLRVTVPPMTTIIGELDQVSYSTPEYTWWHGDTQVYPRLLFP